MEKIPIDQERRSFIFKSLTFSAFGILGPVGFICLASAMGVLFLNKV